MVVHLAFRHDVAFSGDYETAAASDRAAIDALTSSGKKVLVASGTLGLAPGRVTTENDRPDPAAHPRIANATLALERGGVVVRFAPTVHGTRDSGFLATLVAIARETGVSGYLGDGSNRWPAVHVSDAADLTRRAAETAPAGTVLHATAEDGVTTLDIATAIGERLGVPVKPVEDPAHFRFLAGFFGADAPASSLITRELLAWQPTGATLVEDIATGAYG